MLFSNLECTDNPNYTAFSAHGLTMQYCYYLRVCPAMQPCRFLKLPFGNFGEANHRKESQGSSEFHTSHRQLLDKKPEASSSPAGFRSLYLHNALANRRGRYCSLNSNSLRCTCYVSLKLPKMKGKIQFSQLC